MNFTNELGIAHEFSENHRITLFEGDTLALLKEMPAESVDLVITSPPYNVGKEYEVKTSIEKYLAEQETVIKELIRVLKDTGSICWQVGNYVEKAEVFPLDIFYYQLFKQQGLQLRNRIIWYFGHGLHASKRFSGRYETLLWFSKTPSYQFFLDKVRVPSKYPGKRHFKGDKKGQPSGNPLGKNPSDIWEIVAEEWEKELWDIPNCKSNHPEKTIHPCQFPIELVERCVLAFTQENDLVLDPYCGVGSTLLGALKHQRRTVGAEKEAIYSKITQERILELYNGTLKTRPLGKPVHVPTGREKVAQIPKEWEGLFNPKNVQGFSNIDVPVLILGVDDIYE